MLFTLCCYISHSLAFNSKPNGDQTQYIQQAKNTHVSEAEVADARAILVVHEHVLQPQIIVQDAEVMQKRDTWGAKKFTLLPAASG